jgi:competence protein ComEC
MRFLHLLIIFDLLMSILLIKVIRLWPDGKLHYIQCNVGQGDAILITRGFTQVLIDSGKDNQVLNCLDKYIPFWDRDITVMVGTHSDTDHIGGFKAVIDKYQSQIFINNDAGGDNNWQKISQQLKAKNIPIKSVYNLDKLKVNGLDLDFLWPKSRTLLVSKTNADNQSSIVLQLHYQDFQALLTADVPQLIEEELLSLYGQNLKSTVLKVGHHGSKESTSADFLTEVKPKIATIGVGKNSYGHPSSQVLEILKQNHIPVYRSDQNGDIVITSDGKQTLITN